MFLRSLIKKFLINYFIIILCVLAQPAFAESNFDDASQTIDRIQLATKQIDLLKSRLEQNNQELTVLQKQHDQELSLVIIEKASKNLLNKASLDITVSKSNLESLNIELTDCQQTINWLEKSIQEMHTQLNVIGIFGSKMAKNQIATTNELHADLSYQKKLLDLEKSRYKYLQELQRVVSNISDLRKESFNHLNTVLKSRKILLVKQQQVKDELIYQEQQNHWLQNLNELYGRLNKIDPATDSKEYAALEREIFYTNENANYTYLLSLIARYQDQIQQMKLTVLRSNSISLLNEMSDQLQTLSKQLIRLDLMIKTREGILEKHIQYTENRNQKGESVEPYLGQLTELKTKYNTAALAVVKINDTMAIFRSKLDRALQSELSARQGFQTVGLKTFLDLGKELLLVPTLTFQVIKSLSSDFMEAFRTTTLLGWSLFALTEFLLLTAGFLVFKLLGWILNRPSKWRDQINSKWLSLQCLYRNIFDLTVITNIIAIFFFFNISLQNFTFIIYLSIVWLIFKSLFTLSRICLVETTHHASGHDIKLHHRLKWIILMGGSIIALTVFVHQLPLIYDLKLLCDRSFLLFCMIVSLLLLRSWDVVPNLILSHMDTRHRYFKRAIRFIGILVPLLMFGNSLIGLMGYMNLVRTISWYEGIFLMVLIAYIILRGFLSDGMEHLSRLTIQYVKNGWLLTEAFLKPLDKVLRITLFLMAWAGLFLLYGWDERSPIVERLTRLLHYHLANVLNTIITPISIIELIVLISIFYWTAKWTREFVYRLLMSRTQDMGIRNSIAILSQYTVIIVGGLICLRVLGIDLTALAFAAGMFTLGVGLGLRDLANNFACGFLILLERPLRVGDIVNINNIEGEVTNIGSRAITVRTSDHMELVVPNTEIFNKSFTNWTARDNIVRTVIHVKISRFDNPHIVKAIIENVLVTHPLVLKEPIPDVYLKEMNDTLMDFELRYYINIREVKARGTVISSVLMNIWDRFAIHGIKPPYPQHEVFIRQGDLPALTITDSANN